MESVALQAGPLRRSFTDEIPDLARRGYRVLARAGQGVAAVVWKALDIPRGSLVAIKLLRRAAVDQETAVRLSREVEVLRRLNHPAIVKVYRSETYAGGKPFVVMEWIEGKTLRERMRRKPLTRDEVRHVMVKLCDALEAAHEAGVIHRDLKPENVMLQGRQLDRVRVVDFGMAKVLGEQSTSVSGVVCGTPHYMSPERTRGEQVGPAADVYALGVMLFELLAGKRPFCGRNAATVIAKHNMADVPEIPGESDELQCLIRRAMSKYPRFRPSAAQLKAEIERLVR